MTRAAIDALRTERALLLDVLHSLTDAEWEAPSACAGWRVQDVVAHQASSMRMVVDPASIPPGGGDDFEADAELPVAARSEWSHGDVLGEYEEYSAAAIEALAGAQDLPGADMLIPLANLGTHPLHLLADAIAFDHYCHLRNDLLAPRGSLHRPRPSDDSALAPTVTWFWAAYPQQGAQALTFLDRPVAFRLTGTGGGEWTLSRRVDGALEVAAEIAPNAAATLTSSTDALVLWGTKRADWRDHVDIDGDVEYATRVLDVMKFV